MRKELVAQKDPKSPISEIFRTLRTNIQFMNTKNTLKTLLITSTMPSEGKTWIASNLAITFAQAGKRVALVDCDMRKGRLHKMFQLNSVPGLSNYLSGIDETGKVDNDNINKYIQRTEVENLYLIATGNVPPNPSELLASEKTNTLLEILKQNFDIIILDGTPCQLVTDSIILSRIVDSTLLIAEHKETKKDALEKVKRSIENVGGKIAGVVINKVPVNIQKYKSTYYYSSSDRNIERRINSIATVFEKENIRQEKTDEIIKQLDEYINKKKDNNV